LPLGALGPELARADCVVFESTAGLLLVDRVAALTPGARLVYRVSDDLQLLGAPQAVQAAERAALPRFARVSVPSAALLRRFAGVPQAALDPHGVPAAALDAPTPRPFPSDGATHAVFVGVSWLDTDALGRAAGALPDWRFHVIGPHPGVPRLPNVEALGELPFEATVPYLQHADVGLAMLDGGPGMEVFTDSLKILQYTWCRLPIVAPEALRSGRPHVHTYRPGDAASIRAACLAARAHDRATIPRAGIQTWDALAATLAGEGA
jgi:2-beta-glucuronyltransferase